MSKLNTYEGQMLHAGHQVVVTHAGDEIVTYCVTCRRECGRVFLLPLKSNANRAGGGGMTKKNDAQGATDAR